MNAENAKERETINICFSKKKMKNIKEFSNSSVKRKLKESRKLFNKSVLNANRIKRKCNFFHASALLFVIFAILRIYSK